MKNKIIILSIAAFLGVLSARAQSNATTSTKPFGIPGVATMADGKPYSKYKAEQDTLQQKNAAAAEEAKKSINLPTVTELRADEALVLPTGNAGKNVPARMENGANPIVNGNNTKALEKPTEIKVPVKVQKQTITSTQTPPGVSKTQAPVINRNN
jgi:hypothetical protein